ncbi:MAG: hypothetical protein CVV41_21640 [Candidatus Riflebacteria bacterium HGW-Riflebacteria-1]|nr:MAG: hypothetical protein CVV41_21640 [Candidatus Riflebacteria bacterium HGW-Riflebacteria-1]
MFYPDKVKKPSKASYRLNIYFGVPSGDTGNIEEKEISKRLIGSLTTLPCHTREFTTDDPYPFDAIKGTPSLIHAFHAAKAGMPCHKLAEKARLPLVVTCTGLDAYIDMYNSVLRPQLQEVLEFARKVIVPYPQMGKFIKSRLMINTEIEVIAPGIAPFNSEFDFPREHFGFSKGERLIILEGGLLPAKNVIFAIHYLEKLIPDYPELRLIIFKTPFDTDYQKQVVAEIPGRPWIRLIDRPEDGLLPFLYRQAEVFINVSHAEGYNPFLLSAMQTGRPVLAADVYGNHAFIKNEETFQGLGNGWLYFTSPGPGSFARIHDGEDFTNKLRFLLDNPGQASEVGQRAARIVAQSYTAEKELYLHLQVYKALLR